MAGIGIGISPLVYNGQLQKTMRAWRLYTDTTLAVTPLSSTSMGLEWTNPVIQGATLEGVLVYRGTDGVNFTLVETLGVVTYWEDTGLTEGTLYYYSLAFRSSRGVVTGMGEIKSGTTFTTMSDAYFTAMTEQIPTPTKVVIDTAIKATATQLGKKDCVMLTLANEQQSLLWLNDPTKTGTKVNSPTFTPFKGWTGNATNYINTGFNAGDGIGIKKLSINDNSILIYKNNSYSEDNRRYVASTGAASISIGYPGGSMGILGHNFSASYNPLVAFGSVMPVGFGAIRRNSSIKIKRQFNKTIVEVDSSSISVLNTQLNYIISGDRSPLFMIGAYLTDEEMSDFQDAWLPVLEHLGSDYWSNFTPTTLTATAGAGKIDLAWTLPVTTYSPYTVTNVVIQESTDNVTFTDLTTLGAVTSHSVTVPTGQTRYYKIRYISSRNIHTTNSAEAHATAL